jgi:hypothetical protein
MLYTTIRIILHKRFNREFCELVFKVYLHDEGGVQSLDERPIYRQQLVKYFLDDPNFNQLQKRLDRVRYEEKGLGSFVRTINNEQTSSPEIKKKKSAFFVSGGMLASTYKVDGFPNLSGMDYSTGITPCFGLGIDIFSGRKS